MKACNFIQSCTNVERLLNSLHAYPTNSSYIQSTMRRNILQLIMTFLFNFLPLLLWQLLDIRNIFSEETETTYCSYYKVSYVVLYLSSPSLLILKKYLLTFFCNSAVIPKPLGLSAIFITAKTFNHFRMWELERWLRDTDTVSVYKANAIYPRPKMAFHNDAFKPDTQLTHLYKYVWTLVAAF